MLGPQDKARRGFTLVEMLVVLAIITTLGGIVFASLGPARESARRAVCRSNLHQIGKAIAMYREASGGEEVIGGPQTAAQLGLPASPAPLYPYLRNTQVFRCPNEDWEAIFPGDHGPVSTSYSWHMGDGGGRPFGMKVAARGEDAILLLCLHHDPEPRRQWQGTAYRSLLRLSGRVEGRPGNKAVEGWQW